MKVAELMEALGSMNPDDLVIMSRDAEGNGYSDLASVETGRKLADGLVR